MLSVDTINLVKNGNVLLKDVTLNLHQGEVVAVVGPNGAGKSTLLKSMAVDMKPDSGLITINGKPAQQWIKKDLATVRAVLPQQSLLSFPFTVNEIVYMGRIPHINIRGKSHHDSDITQAAIHATGIEALADREFTSLSGGEQQRVHLARVLAQIWEPFKQQPCFLLLDEPTSALDIAHQHQVLKTARRMALEKQVGVLAVVHDLNLAACYADRLVMMRRGRIEHVGKTRDTLNSDTVKQVFDIDCEVFQHQVLGCPCVITIPPNFTANG